MGTQTLTDQSVVILNIVEPRLLEKIRYVANSLGYSTKEEYKIGMNDLIVVFTKKISPDKSMKSL